jgi:S-adenosylmethionine-diacylglycerol 3-amino-3-carboxypropyl transferase
MQSEFHRVELDRIRYSLVWEDFNTLYDALDYKSKDRLLIITSAGCNVLNSILAPIESVTAIDLNPVQNALLKLKMYIIQNHDYQIYASVLGLLGPERVQKAWLAVSMTLPTEDKDLWDKYFKELPEGLLLTGKLEQYVAPFLSSLSIDIKDKLSALLGFSTPAEQYAFFIAELDCTEFRHAFINYFNEANLSKGRDSKLFKYAEEQCGEIFYSRLKDQLKDFLVRENFYFRFFFFGIQDMPHLLPACYQEKNYEGLKNSLHKINIVTGEAVDYLLSDSGSKITKAGLSNIFEYTTHEVFNAVCSDLASHNPSLTFIYWNLLQEQALNGNISAKHSLIHPRKESCFYFRNTNLISFIKQ